MTDKDSSQDEPERIDVDRDPTAEEEARETFQNPDERIQAQRNSHELKMLQARKGFIGKATGSANESLNSAMFMISLFVLVLLIVICIHFFSDSDVAFMFDSLVGIIATVIGYTLGVHRQDQ